MQLIKRGAGRLNAARLFEHRFNPRFSFWHPEPQQYTPHRLVRDRNFTLQTPARCLAASCAPLGIESTGILTRFPYDFSGTSPSPLFASPGFLLPVVDSTPDIEPVDDSPTGFGRTKCGYG